MSTFRALIRSSEWMWTEQARFVVLACFAFLILFPGFHPGNLRGYDDALYAHEAKQMIQTGDWWSVRFNGVLNFEYPPMFMWMEALSMKVFGITDFAAKFPVALLGFATILLTYVLAFELSADRWLSLLAMAILLSTQYFIKYSTHAMTDVPCTFFFLLAVFAYVRGFRSPWFLLISGSAIGCAILTRSVVGLLPLPIFFSHWIVTRRLKVFPLRQVLAGLLLAFAIPGIWYFSQYRLHGSIFAAAVLAFVSGKISTGKFAFWPRLSDLLVYPKLMLRSYWPWLPLLIAGLFKLIRRTLTLDSTAVLLMLWIAWFIFPFSMSHEKVLRYLMPVFPAFALIAAFSLNDWIPAHRRPQILKYMYGLGAAGVFCVLLLPFFSQARADDMRQLAPIANANCPPEQSIVLYTWGRLAYDYNNQLLWYADRFTELPLGLEGVKADFEDASHTVVIMDRNSYQKFPEMLGPRFIITTLAESENFVCFKAIRRLP